MTYVTVKRGGFKLSADNEINGLTLGGVGRETDIDYIEVFNNKDDSIEFFGGAAALIEGGSASCTAAGSSGERSLTPYTTDANYQLGPAGGLQLEIEDDVFYCFGAPALEKVNAIRSPINPKTAPSIAPKPTPSISRPSANHAKPTRRPAARTINIPRKSNGPTSQRRNGENIAGESSGGVTTPG